MYFHRPATRQNSTDHRGTIRTFVPLSTASPRQDGNKFALHPLIRIFPKYSNAATLKKNLAPPAGCTIFAEDRKRFGNLCVQTRTITLTFHYLCRRQETARTSSNNRRSKHTQRTHVNPAMQGGRKQRVKFDLSLAFHYLQRDRI